MSTNRDALRRILEDVAAARGGESEPQSYDDGIDAILALVRPVEDIALSRDEALARIEALCDAGDADRERHLALHPEDEGVLHASVEVDALRAVLTDVQPRYWLPAAFVDAEASR